MRTLSVLRRPDWASNIPSRQLKLLYDPDSLVEDDVKRRFWSDDDRRNVAIRLSILDLRARADEVGGRQAAELRRAADHFENVLVDLNGGLLGQALSGLKGRYDQVSEQARENARMQLATRLQRWDPSQSPLSSWVKKALSGEVQKTLREAKHETLPNRTYARRPEIVEAAQQLREDRQSASIRSILDHMRLTAEQATQVVTMVESGDAGKVESTFSSILGPRRARRVATVAAALHRDGLLDVTSLIEEALPTPEQVKDVVDPTRLIRTSTPVGGEDDDLTVGDTLTDTADEADDGGTPIDLLQCDGFVDALTEHQLWFAIGKFQYGDGHATRETDLLQEMGLTRGSAPTFKQAIEDAGRQDGLVDDEVLARRLGSTERCECGADEAPTSDDVPYVPCDEGCPAQQVRAATERRRQERLADDVVDLHGLELDTDVLEHA